MDLTQKINDVNNFFYLNQSCITIGEFLPLLKELYENLEEFFEVKKFEMPELKKMSKWYELIKNRKAIEKLPEDEVKQIALDIVMAYETLKKLLQ